MFSKQIHSKWLGFALVTGILCLTSLAEAGRNNPFTLPEGVDFISNLEPVVEMEETHLRLDGVILGQKKVAIINNRDVLLGQSIDGRQLLEVHKDHVLLEGKSGPFKLQLNRKPFTVKVTHPPAR